MTRFTKRFTLSMVCAMVVLSALSVGAAPGDDAVLSQFKAIRERYAGAVSAGDIETFASLWDENGIRMPPNAPWIVGRAAIRAAMEKAFSLFTFEMVTIPDEYIITGDYIIVRGHYTVTQRPKKGGDPIYTDAKNLTVWKKQADGGWRLYRDCFNTNTP